MIRLRGALDGALANPWLRFFLIGILATLLALVFVHGIADGVQSNDEALICVAFVVLLMLKFIVRPATRECRVSIPLQRGPPRSVRGRVHLGPLPPAAPVPLRR